MIQWCLDTLNYLTITILMIIESPFIPFPSEIVIPPAAYKAASTGELNFALIVLFGTLGALIGALINYFLSIWLGRPIVHKFAKSRIGAMMLLSEEKVDKAEHFFVQHGNISTLVGRLIPGIRQLISVPAGLARMPLSSFVLYTSIGAGIWNLVLASIGWYLEGVVPEDELMIYVNKYSHQIGLGIIIVVVMVLTVISLKALRRPKLTEIEEPTEQE